MTSDETNSNSDTPPAKSAERKRKRKPAKPELPEWGVGYLRHFHRDHEAYAARLEQISAQVDLYEILAIHFFAEPNAAAPFARRLAKPVIIHSSNYYLGNVERPSQAMRDKIQGIVNDTDAVLLSEHASVMGTADTYNGTFFTPLGTEEQTELLIKNTLALKKETRAPVILENSVCFYPQIGPYSIAQQLGLIAEKADVDLLLSLSNVAYSDPYQPIDRDAFFADYPLERIVELHCFLGNSGDERNPGLAPYVEQFHWQMRTLEELAKRPEFRPKCLIWEIDGTDNWAEPERLKEIMDWSRALLFSDQKEAAA